MRGGFVVCAFPHALMVVGRGEELNWRYITSVLDIEFMNGKTCKHRAAGGWPRIYMARLGYLSRSNNGTVLALLSIQAGCLGAARLRLGTVTYFVGGVVAVGFSTRAQIPCQFLA